MPCSRHSAQAGASGVIGMVPCLRQARRLAQELSRLMVLWDESWVHTLLRVQPDVER